MTQPTWPELLARNPQHSANYAARWRRLEQEGNDIVGEARLVDALAERSSRILDAGCGTGRIGGYLAEHGHQVVGVDLDPYLIDIAQTDFPGATWQVGDLCDPEWAYTGFDLVVSAGNVMVFLEPAGRAQALANLAHALRPEGRLVVGFGAGRGWSFDDFLAEASQAGLDQEQLWSTWNAHPYTDGSDFLVAVLRRAGS